MFRNLSLLASTPILCAVLTQNAMAQGVGQRGGSLDEIIVVGGYVAGTLTSPSLEEARQRLEQIPGGIGFVESDVFLDDFAQSIGDALVFTPGVFADTSAQRENRISVRGSGLNSAFERRGLTLLRDGVPITRASGSTEYQEIDPLSIRYIEIYKGANGLEYGGASLGGAINIVTPTGRTVKDRLTFRAEGGSFNTFRANATYGEAFDNSDIYIGVTGLTSDGFRDHSGVDSVYGFMNYGYQINENVETRFYVTALSDNFELSGSLALDDALENPTAAGRPVTIGPFFPGGPVTVLDPGPEADDWDRNLDVVRVANRTVANIDGITLEGGLWYAYRDLDHAITRFAGIIAQQENEFGLFGRASGTWNLGNMPVDWTFGGMFNTSSNDAKRFENLSGERGELTSQADQDASNIVLYGQTNWLLTDQVTTIVGFQYLKSIRDVEDIFDPESSGRLVSDQVNPRFGLLWNVNDNAQVFANVNRGFEPANTSDITAGGALDFTPLRSQKSWTVEFGSRGQLDFLSWDMAVYRSWVDNEFIDQALPSFGGFISRTFNADNTIHQGIELGVDFNIQPDALKNAGLALTWRNIYTYNDFHFDNDPIYGNNKLAGVPDHIYVSELKLDSEENWYFAINFRWIPDGPFVDYANTLQTPGYELFGMTAGIELTENVTIFASAENLFDQKYISNISTVADQSLENANVFTPGQGQAFFGGLTAKF